MKLVPQYLLVALFAVLRKVVCGVAMTQWLARCTQDREVWACGPSWGH